MRDRGYGNLLGVDPSPRCAELAQQAYGLQVAAGTIETWGGVQGLFRLVLLTAVLEHLLDPVRALKRVRELLDLDGLLLVEVPDVVQFAACLDAPFQQFSLEHVGYFSAGSLQNLAAVAGFALISSRQHTVEQSVLSRAPALCAVFKKAETPEAVMSEKETEAALLDYIRVSAALEVRLERKIADLAASGRSVLVWGAGTHTQHLLATTRLAEVGITAFVDSNPHYYGKQLNGIPILPPEAVLAREEPILISSAISQEEIARQVRVELGWSNELICLYGESD